MLFKGRITANADGLPPFILRDVEAICGEVAALLAQYCRGEMRFEVLRREHPVMEKMR